MMPLNSSTPLASADRDSLTPSEQAIRKGDRHVASTAAAGDDDQRNSSGKPTTPPAARRPLQIPKIKTGLPLHKRPQEVRRIAVEVFPAADSWVVFFREILGSGGIVRQLFRTVDEIRYWESTDEFLEIQEMVTALRSNESGKGDSAEPQRMITVRLPTSLHEALKTEAEEHQTSMNKLCMSKLLMSIDGRFIPIESGRIRGRKPGPQGKRKTPAEQPSE